jgi:hypothetical protein
VSKFQPTEEDLQELTTRIDGLAECADASEPIAQPKHDVNNLRQRLTLAISLYKVECCLK